jgi:hypothetical protein
LVEERGMTLKREGGWGGRKDEVTEQVSRNGEKCTRDH